MQFSTLIIQYFVLIARTEKIRLISFLVITGLLLATGETFSVSNPQLDLALRSITKASAPKIIERHLILTYSSELQHRYVAAKFSHESFSKLHMFSLNENNVFVLAFPLKQYTETLKYLLVVDGIFTTDPNNQTLVNSSLGTALSSFTVPIQQIDLNLLPHPQINNDGTVTFRLQTYPNRRVTVTGDFAAWDPFLFNMKEISTGLYSTTIRISEGRHYYYFLANGIRVIDPNNPELAQDERGGQLSSFLHKVSKN